PAAWSRSDRRGRGYRAGRWAWDRRSRTATVRRRGRPGLRSGASSTLSSHRRLDRQVVAATSARRWRERRLAGKSAARGDRSIAQVDRGSLAWSHRLQGDEDRSLSILSAAVKELNTFVGTG